MAKYEEAFNQLGYKLNNPLNDVSAEKSDGVVLAIFRDELRNTTFDTREVLNWDQKRSRLAGNRRRIQHLSRAVSELDSKVDVILVEKNSKGRPNDKAEAWTRPNSYWKVTFFDPTTGHHRVELVRD